MTTIVAVLVRRLMAGRCVSALAGMSKRRSPAVRRLDLAAVTERPLPWLYRAIVRAHKARLRQIRRTTPGSYPLQLLTDTKAGLLMSALGWSPSRTHRQARVLRVAQLMIRWTDDAIDTDERPNGGAADQFLVDTTHVVETLAAGRPGAGRVLTEHLPLIYVVLAADRLLDLKLAGLLREAWNDYVPDARRIRAGEPVATPATIKRAMLANETLGYVGALVLGLPPAQAKFWAALDVPNITHYDTACDLEVDVRERRLFFSREQLAEAGLTPEAILNSAWLLGVPGLTRFCAGYVERHGEEWAGARPQLEREVLPCIRSRRARRRVARNWKRRTEGWSALREHWEQHAATAPEPPEFCFDGDLSLTPASYAAVLDSPRLRRVGMTEAFDGLAATLGISVSRDTRERWRRLWACVWINDRLAERGTDAAQALELAERIICGRPPAPADMPAWVVPSAQPATELLRSSLARTASADRVLELLLERCRNATQIAATTDVHTYAGTVLSGSRQLALAGALCASDQERQHPRFAELQRLFQELLAVCELRDASDNLTGAVRASNRQLPARRMRRILRRRLRWRLWRTVLRNPGHADILLGTFERYERIRTGATAPRAARRRPSRLDRTTPHRDERR